MECCEHKGTNQQSILIKNKIQFLQQTQFKIEIRVHKERKLTNRKTQYPILNYVLGFLFITYYNVMWMFLKPLEYITIFVTKHIENFTSQLLLF